MINDSLKTLWTLNLASTFFMTGLIWLIQVVHYPLMSYVPDESFSKFHQAHSSRITWVVFPVMLVELLTGAGLFFLFHEQIGFWTATLPFLFSAVTFFGTGLVFVPIHSKLQSGPTDALIKLLVRANWARTLVWSIHAIFMVDRIPF